MDFQVERARRFVHILHSIIEKGIFRVEKDRNQTGLWSELMQEPQSLALHLIGKEAYPGEIVAGTIQPFHQTGFDGISANPEHDRHR